MMTNLNPKDFEYIKLLSWPEVFEIWRATEASNPNWEAHYKERGFNSWEEWRKVYSTGFRCADREWHFYKIIDPLGSVPKFHGGPFRGWKEKYYAGDELPTFNQLIQNPEIEQHDYVRQLMNDFPKETTITGLLADNGIVIIEGMHRCLAIALAASLGRTVKSDISVALADAAGETLSIVGGTRKSISKEVS